MSESAQVTGALVADTNAACSHIDSQDAAIALYKQRVSEDAATLASQSALIIQQAARIAELEGPTPPDPDPDPPVPPVGRRMLMGATVDAKAPLTKAQTIAEWIAKCGPLDVVRIFVGGAPTTASLATALAAHDSRDVILSYKGDATDSVLKSIKQIPGRTVVLVKWHEPENDGGTHTAPWFRSQTNAHIAQVRGLGRPDLQPGFVLMTWLERDPEASTTSRDWMPTGDLTGVVMILDPYDPNNKLSMDQLVTPTLALWKAQGGTRWAIGETGTHRTGTAGADWIRASVAWCEKNGCEWLCWFHSAVGAAAGPNGWWLSDPTMQAAWKALASA